MAALTFGRRLRGERGAEIIEMALVTPIFLVIIAAMFDFGFLFRNWEVATNAAREGARIGLLPSYKCDGTSTDVKDRVDAYMASAGFNAAAYQVKQMTQQFPTGAGTFTGCAVSVEITQPMPMLSTFGALFGDAFGSVPLRATSVMRTESQAAAP
jgi:Flp pilus assembly protein TadG